MGENELKTYKIVTEKQNKETINQDETNPHLNQNRIGKSMYWLS